MATYPVTSVLLALSLLTPGCSTSQDISGLKQACTTDWYSVVEKQVSTGDGYGHGPDLGSGEWRSVVEYKLGIRGNPEVPSRGTDQWCDYIDTYYIQPVR